MEISDTLIMHPDSLATSLPHYELRREIGRGGMSTVYEARDTRTGQDIALKILALPQSLKPEQQRDLIARFGREARAVAHLSHPNIVVIHEVGEGKGSHFLAMEYLVGQTLRERLSQGPFTPAQAQPILTQIAGALDAVHQAGIVHRDVKPSNVMLLPDGTAKLLDFGIARQSDDTTITSTGMIIGSPAYMAPEQVQGETGTAASDIWALGVLAYEMLAGRPPFDGKNIPAVLYQVTHKTPLPIAGMSAAVQKVLRRALDKNSARRFPTAGAFAEAMCAAQPERPAGPRLARPAPLLLPHPWLWATLLLPLLLGITWGVRIHQHSSTPAPLAATPPASRATPPASRATPPASREAAPPVSGQVMPSASRLAPPVSVPTPVTKGSTQVPTKISLTPPITPGIKKEPVAAQTAKSAKSSPQKHTVKNSSPKRRNTATTHSRASRRFRAVSHRFVRRSYRFAPRRSRSGYDSQAAAQLQRFIWAEGR